MILPYYAFTVNKNMPFFRTAFKNFFLYSALTSLFDRAGITPSENVRYIAADPTETGWEKALLQNPDFNGSANTFCSLLGLVYYLTTADFVWFIL